MSTRNWNKEWSKAVDAAFAKKTIGHSSKDVDEEEDIPPTQTKPIAVKKFKLGKGDLIDQYFDSHTKG